MSGNRPGPLTILFTFLILVGAAAAVGGAALFMALFVAVLILLYPLLRPLWKRIYGLPDLADQVFYAETEDGWRLALHYHEPRLPVKGSLPVLLVHGIATDKNGVDLDEQHSVACYLRSRGFPVFAVSLRGGGLSHYGKGGRPSDLHANGSGDQPADQFGGPIPVHHSDDKQAANRKRFTFDDYVRFDAPAIVQRVIELTGAPALNWVGYSMGGMIGNAFCSSNDPRKRLVQSLVTIGSPGKSDHVGGFLMNRLVQHPWMKRMLPLQPGSAILAPLGGWIQTPIDRILYDPASVRRRTVQRMLQNAITEVNQGLLDEMARWVREGTETSNDGQINYRKTFKRIRCPTMMIAGAGDHIAPAIQVRYAFDQCGARHKRFVLAGKRQGYEFDYCHIGLVMGEKAANEIFIHVFQWLKKHGMAKQSRWKSWMDRWQRNKTLRTLSLQEGRAKS